jgi:signal transduction histidine kinase
MATRLRTSTQQMIFLGVAVLLFVQMGWWIQLQVRQSAQLLTSRINELKAGRAEAWQMDSRLIIPYYAAPETTFHRGVVEGKLPSLVPTLEQRTKAIETAFPHVAVVKAPVEWDDPQLVDLSGFLTLRREPIQQLEAARRLTLWRAALEGAFMAAGVLFGFFLIYRKLTEEMDLKLRQKNFIAAVTHELKTPISSLRVWMETVFDRPLTGEQRVMVRDRMDKDLERLAELVANLLEVARADAGSLELALSPMELAPWMREVCKAMDERLGPGALGLRVEAAEGVWALADPKALGAVLENLLSNAFKYAPAPRRTQVTLTADARLATITVKDQGLGLSLRELSRVFQRFYRAGDEMTRSVPGTGLGLFLAREIVQRHGGSIRAASLGPGRGSTFTVQVPRIPAPQPAGQAVLEAKPQ